MLHELVEQAGLKLVKDLPAGNYASVCVARDTPIVCEHIEVVCKLFHLEDQAESQEQWMLQASKRKITASPRVLWRHGRLLVYEMAPGETLLEMAQRGCTHQEAIAAALACMSAVYEIAKSGMMHCDIHPGNIIINRSSCKLIDPGCGMRTVDDVDMMISAFAYAGFISQHDARDCGVRGSLIPWDGLPVRKFPNVREVLSGAAPTLRLASREARRATQEEETEGYRGRLENPTASPLARCASGSKS